MKKGFLTKKRSSKRKPTSKSNRSSQSTAAMPSVQDDLPDLVTDSSDSDSPPPLSATGKHRKSPPPDVVLITFHGHLTGIFIEPGNTFGDVKRRLLDPKEPPGFVGAPNFAKTVLRTMSFEDFFLGHDNCKIFPDSQRLSDAGVESGRRLHVILAPPSIARASKTLRVNMPAEVEDAGGVWHPCRILAVEPAGLRCASLSLSTIDEGTLYDTRHFRLTTLRANEPAEVFDGQAWHPCSIKGIADDGIYVDSMSLRHASGAATGSKRRVELFPPEGKKYSADKLRFSTFIPNQPAEVEAAGVWHPCRIIAVEPNGFRCESGSLTSINKNTAYNALHFRFCTFVPGQRAEVEAAGVWHPCTIRAVDPNGMLLQISCRFVNRFCVMLFCLLALFL